MLLTILAVYATVAIAIPAWDAYIGFGFEFPDISDGPSATLTGVFWPIGLPVIMVIVISMAFANAKNGRIKRTREKERLRIALEKEQEQLIREVEEEVFHERKSTYKS